MSFGEGYGQGLVSALLWLWCRVAATVPIQPLAWELPYVMGAALKRKKKKSQCHESTLSSQKTDE